MRYSEPLHYCFAPTEKKQRELITLTVDAPVFVWVRCEETYGWPKHKFLTRPGILPNYAWWQRCRAVLADRTARCKWSALGIIASSVCLSVCPSVMVCIAALHVQCRHACGSAAVPVRSAYFATAIGSCSRYVHFRVQKYEVRVISCVYCRTGSG